MSLCKIIVYGWTFAAEQLRYQLIKDGGGEIVALVAEELPEYWYGSKLIEEGKFLNESNLLCAKDTFIYISYLFDSKEYKEIKVKLENIGLNEFSDYLSSETYGKKMAIINANCHVVPYARYLSASKRFCEEYYIYPLGPLQSRIPIEISEAALRNCDLYIHQLISKGNNYSERISDEYIYPLLKDDCRKLVVPNFADGRIKQYSEYLFPQLKGRNQNHPYINHIEGVFSWRDMIIEECLYRGLGIEAILGCYRDEKLISKEVTQEGYNKFFETFKRIEEKWDIKISDFLEKRKKRILVQPGHPEKEVLEEIGRRILKVLDIEESVQLDFGFVDEYPILDCVSKDLEIKKGEYIRDSGQRMGGLGNRRMDLEEYVRQYIYWVHEYELNRLLMNVSHIVHGRKFIFYHPTGYVRQLLNIMNEQIIDTLDGYQSGTPVVLLLDLDAKIRAQSCVKLGVGLSDIYVIETGDCRKAEIARLVYKYPKVIIYGMGSDFKYLIDYESERIAICDKKFKDDSFREGTEYITVDTLLNKYKDGIVYVTSTQYGKEIQEDLCRKGFPKENIIQNKMPIEKIEMHLSRATVVPLIQSVIWTEELKGNNYADCV